jgi:hypothetical protein
MGTNRRYGSDLTDSAINEAVTRPTPISLSPAEIGGHVTDAVDGLPVTAWVRFPETPIQVEGKAVAWTDRAVWVEFTMHNGRTLRAWVWASAVKRRSR